jgi:hypothetical protein
VLVVGLGAIMGAAVALAPTAGQGPASVPSDAVSSLSPSPAEAPSANANVEDTAHLDPMAPLGRMKSRALEWHRDAVLVSIHAEPVVNGLVDTTAEGHVEYEFGTPAQGFADRARVGADRLKIRIDHNGTSAKEGRGAPASAALEPNCALEDAVRKIVASGVASSAPLAIDFTLSDRYDKAVWRATTLGPDTVTRALDGSTCAILVR